MLPPILVASFTRLKCWLRADQTLTRISSISLAEEADNFITLSEMAGR